MADEVVEVTYVSSVHGVRSVNLPLASYRPATPDELAASQRYQVLPVDQATQEAEIQAIQRDLQLAASQRPQTLEIP